MFQKGIVLLKSLKLCLTGHVCAPPLMLNYSSIFKFYIPKRFLLFLHFLIVMNLNCILNIQFKLLSK